MAASSSSFQRGERRGRWGSPERTVVWTEPKPKPKPKPKPARKVAVVYYLCHRDGHLDHPHFLELELPPRSSDLAPPGLHLRDFTARLNALRGNGMPAMYSWSSKRSYRNGYVWQDLTEDDLIHPAHGDDEYVLKGSPLLLLLHPQPPPASSAAAARHQDAASSSAAAGRRYRKDWSSFDLGDCSDRNSKLLAVAQQQPSAATRMGHHRGPPPDQEDDAADPSMELPIDEISPPPSSSSPDPDAAEREVGVIAGGRMRASAVLMHIFSCGSMTTAAAVKRAGRHARTRSDADLAMAATASGSSHRRAETDAEKEADACASAATSGRAGAMDRDYFSGSLVESSSSKRGGGDGALLLKRSSSCNAGSRGAARLKLLAPAPAKEVRAGCLASRVGRASKKNMTRATAAALSRDDGGGECNGAAAADGAGSR